MCSDLIESPNVITRAPSFNKAFMPLRWIDTNQINLLSRSAYPPSPLFYREMKKTQGLTEWMTIHAIAGVTYLLMWVKCTVSKTAILFEGLAPPPVLSSLSAVVVYIQTAMSCNTLQSGKQEKRKTTKHGLEVVGNNHVWMCLCL